MEQKLTHVPVMADQVIDGLQLKKDEIVVDATTGLGGHTRLMAENVAPGKVYAFDRDARNIEIAKENLRGLSNIEFVHASFGDMAQYVKTADKMLFDLGFSSAHVDDPKRGFSFMHDGPLDMRYDEGQELTAAMIVNSSPKEDIAFVIRKYGEDRWAHRIADAIVAARRKERITRTVQLADIIAAAVPRRGKRHPATNTFQAIRIAVNDEFGEVEKAFTSLEHILSSGGKVAFLTFHSIEDRIVKHLIKDAAFLEQDTKKPLIPTRDEIKSNPRARSAKLRIATKL